METTTKSKGNEQMNKTLEKLKEYIESGAYKYSGPVICKE